MRRGAARAMSRTGSASLPNPDRKAPVGLFANFKRLFMRGLAALLPTLVTIAILIWVYELVNSYIGEYITRGGILFMARLAVPENIDPQVIRNEILDDALAFGDMTERLDPESGQYITRQYEQLAYWYKHDPDAPALRQLITEVTASKYRGGAIGVALGILGFIVAIMLVWVVGVILASFVGRRTWPRIESLVTQLPLIKAIYPHVKQVTDFILSERQMGFSAVVAVQYPRKGLWSLGLMTGDGMRRLSEAAQAETVSVFIPSSPTPFTGYVITVPSEDVVEMQISIDDALRFTVSAGVIVPPSQKLPSATARTTSAERENVAQPSGATDTVIK